MSTSPPAARRLRREAAALFVVDIQEKLMPLIFERERVVRNAVLLIETAKVLGLPMVVTEQYPQGLGTTLPEIRQALGAFYQPIAKLTFSGCGIQAAQEAMQTTGRTQWLIVGIESHVCVVQTVLDMLEMGLEVYVAADAVSSRAESNYRLGLERMRDAGAVLTSAEMAIYEMLREAGTEEFRAILKLVK
ncbi:MAG: hydrolase [Abditibacteriales bacterium]|nr:hydrolase [Abditibacteriales bacterium]MDW8368350.1 hydrolase [Abditibacteriales bacterium]